MKRLSSLLKLTLLFLGVALSNAAEGMQHHADPVRPVPPMPFMLDDEGDSAAAAAPDDWQTGEELYQAIDALEQDNPVFIDQLKEKILANPALVHYVHPTSSRRTLLHLTISKKLTQTTETLLECGAPLDLIDADGRTPQEFAYALIPKKIEPNLTPEQIKQHCENKNQHKAIYILICDYIRWKALWGQACDYAARDFFPGVTRVLDSVTCHMHPHHFRHTNGKFLAECSLNPATQDEVLVFIHTHFSEEPEEDAPVTEEVDLFADTIFAAIEAGDDTAVLRALDSASKDTYFPYLNYARESDNATLLHVAAQHNRLAVAQSLLEKKAYPAPKDIADNTPVQVAEAFGHIEMAELITWRIEWRPVFDFVVNLNVDAVKQALEQDHKTHPFRYKTPKGHNLEEFAKYMISLAQDQAPDKVATCQEIYNLIHEYVQKLPPLRKSPRERCRDAAAAGKRTQANLAQSMKMALMTKEERETVEDNQTKLVQSEVMNAVDSAVMKRNAEAKEDGGRS